MNALTNFLVGNRLVRLFGLLHFLVNFVREAADAISGITGGFETVLNSEKPRPEPVSDFAQKSARDFWLSFRGSLRIRLLFSSFSVSDI